MPLGDYVVGLAFFAAILAGTGLAALWVVRRQLPELAGAPRFLAFGMLWVAALLVAHLVPAIAGILSRVSVAVVATALAACALRLGRAPQRDPSPAHAPDPAAGRLPWILAALSVGVTALFLIAFLRGNATRALFHFDAVSFHVPGVARWIQTGSVWQNDEFVPGYAFGNYPQYGDVLQLAVVLPWRSDAFVRLVNLPLLVLAAASVYGIARELRVPRPLATSLSAILAAVPVAVLPAVVEAQVDTLFLAAFGTAVLFLLRHLRTCSWTDLVLAGLGLGIAFGTKWYAMAYVPLALAAWVVGSWRAQRPPRRIALEGSCLAGLVLATGGFWLLRNAITVGNPFFPQRLQVLGVVLFDAPPDTIRDRYGHTIADYLDQRAILGDYIWPAVRAYMRLPGGLIAAGAAAAAAVLVMDRIRGRRRVTSGPAALLVLLAAAIAVVYTLLPNSALGPEGAPIFVDAAARYVAPAVLLGAAVTAWVSALSDRVQVLVQGVAVAAIALGLQATLDVEAKWLAAAAVALAILAAIATAAWLARRKLARLGRPTAIALGACAVVVVAAGGHVLQERFDRYRYRADVDAPLRWITTNAPEGARIGIAGTWSGAPGPILPAFGPRLRNDVEVVGPFRREMLREYTNRSDFLAAVRRGRYDLLLIGRMKGVPGWARQGTAGYPREERWARSLGYERVARSTRLSLYAGDANRAAAAY